MSSDLGSKFNRVRDDAVVAGTKSGRGANDEDSSCGRGAPRRRFASAQALRFCGAETKQLALASLCQPHGLGLATDGSPRAPRRREGVHVHVHVRDRVSSVVAVTACFDRIHAGQHRARAVRSQAAFLRSLLDDVERLAPMSPVHENFGDQIIEELARLGCRSLEAASELTRVVAAARYCA